MAKMMRVNTNEALREYRLKALTSPLSAYEMTSLDKEMGDILSKTDVPTEIKMKLFYDALNKFQVTRKRYIDDTAVVSNQQPPIKPVTVSVGTTTEDPPPVNQKDDVDSDLTELSFDDRDLIIKNPHQQTPNIRQRSASFLRDFPPESPKKEQISDQGIIKQLQDTDFIASQIEDAMNTSLSGIIYTASPGSGKKGKSRRAIGNVNEIKALVSDFTNSVKRQKPKNPTVSSELKSIVSDHLFENYFSNLKSLSKTELKSMYPNMQMKSFSVRKEPLKRSPVGLRSKSATAVKHQQVGQGRILKIHFNKWNQLISKK